MGAKSKSKPAVPVSMRALVQRINRKIKDDDRVMKKTRGQRAIQELGEYHVLNWRGNWVDFKDADPEEWGRELGVLKSWERVIED